jgi:hypothetical protein
MHELKEHLPVKMEAPGMKIRELGGWGDMVVTYNEFPGGTDFTPMLEGLPNDKCHCPHWGYVVKGAINIRYADGTEEMVRAGEVFYMPPGHTAWIEEDTAWIDFSPEKEYEEVMAHVTSKMSE